MPWAIELPFTRSVARDGPLTQAEKYMRLGLKSYWLARGDRCYANRALGRRQSRLGLALLAVGILLFWQQSSIVITESGFMLERVHGLAGHSPASVAVLVAVLCAGLVRQEPPSSADAAMPLRKREDHFKACLISFLLCLVSGMVNMVAFYEMSFLVSGNMGRLGPAGVSCSFIILCYMIGAGVTGYCKSNSDAPIRGYYCPAMLAAGVATLAGVWLYVAGKGGASPETLGLWAFGQGLQNGVTTKCSTLAGSISDLGSKVGLWLRALLRGEAAPPMANAVLLILCLLGYALGAFAALVGTEFFGIYAALAPGVVMALVGLGRGPAPDEKLV